VSAFEVKCLEAKYDPETQVMAINCVFTQIGERKIVVLGREDVETFINRGPLKDEHIHFFADMLSQRKEPFKISIEDDPNTKKLTPHEELEYAAMFKNRIGDELNKVCEGLVDETGKMKRKLGDLLDKGKVDAIRLLEEEKVLRGKIG
jgi:hypothetical protein